MTDETPEETLEQLYAWADLVDVSSYYEILGILEIADDEGIKSAFHEFALAFHPDLHPSPVARHLATHVFQRGAEAYRVLLDPEQRAAYDLALATGRLRLSSAPPPPGSEASRSSAPPSARTLDDLGKSAAAKMCARKADRLISEGDLHGAKRELMMALYHDGNDNPELAERLEALEDVLFVQG